MRKEIIIVYDYFTPAYKAGGPVQSLANMVRELGDTMPIKVLCSNKDLDNSVLNVAANTWVQLADLPVSAFYNSNGFDTIDAAVKNDTEKVFFINGLYSIVYNFSPLRKFTGRKIVSARGMLHPGGLSQKSLKKKLYLAVWKMLQLHHKCEFHATTAEEAQHIKAVFGNDIKTWVVPNFPRVLHPVFAYKKPAQPLKLCTVALISPMKNYLLVIEALMKIKSPVQYDIYGPVKDDAYWQECKVALARLPSNIKVNYNGDIEPSQVQTALSDAHVYIQPSKSENFGHSLFEAMTAGKPVITSEYTPWNDLKNEHAGVNVQVEKIDTISDAVNFFAGMDEEKYKEWCVSARAYALRSTNTENIKKQYVEMFGMN